MKATYHTLHQLDMANIAIQCGQHALQEALYSVCDKLRQNYSSRLVIKTSRNVDAKLREVIHILDDVIVELNKARKPIIEELSLVDAEICGEPLKSIVESKRKLDKEANA